MATFYGHQTLQWLVARGWAVAQVEIDTCGDQHVIDPTNNEVVTVYVGAERQRERTGEYPEFLKD